MKIQNISIKHLQIPMRIRFAQSNNTANQSSSVFLELQTTNDIVGYGESCPRTYVTGEDYHSVKKDLHSIEAELYQKQFNTIDDIKTYVCAELPKRIGMAAICVLEIALLDAWSREKNISILEALGVSPKPVFQYTGVIPFSNLQKLKPILRRFDFKEVKIKVDDNVEKNKERVEDIREFYGSETPIRVDANCSWDVPFAIEQTTKLIEQNITVIEQPFPVAMDKAMRYLTHNFGEWVDIMADESVTSYESAKKLIEDKACTRFNLKLSKNGGIFNTLRIYELAKANGVKCQLGAHFGETSILTVAGMIFASLTTALKAMEGGLGTLLLEKDVCEEAIMINKKAQINGTWLEGKLGTGIKVSYPENSSAQMTEQISIRKRANYESNFRFTLSKSAFRIG